MRRNEIVATVVFVLLAGVVIWRVSASQHDVGSGSSTAPPATPTGATASAPPTASATPGSPSSGGVSASVTQGSAALAISGQVVQSSALDHLVPPGVWSPPPGTMALRWAGDGGSLAIAGDSFTNRVTTSPTLTLTFTARVDGIVKRFRSTAGECAITVSEALPDATSGVYGCTQVASQDGTLVVDAQGTFQASG
jgi:hypothetical protein